jgi:hypothetical protein
MYPPRSSPLSALFAERGGDGRPTLGPYHGPRGTCPDRGTANEARHVADLQADNGDDRVHRGNAQPVRRTNDKRNDRGGDQHANKDHQPNQHAAGGAKDQKTGDQPVHLRAFRLIEGLQDTACLI